MADRPVVDPDVDLHEARQRKELTPAFLAAIAAGGALGGLARYGVSVALPTPTGGFPWATFAINASGCLLIGALMVVVTRLLPRARLLRPFAGVGFLGGFTTFSTYVLDIRNTIAAGRPAVAVLYLFGTLFAAVLAVWAGIVAAERVLR